MTGMICLRFLSVLAVLWAGPALAAGSEQRDASPGETLAHSWCSECHSVARGDLKSPKPGVPSFTAIALQPSTSETSLRAFLTTPHPHMPNIKLTATELNEIVVYILSLRDVR
jgi:mono/diheme cytochrome c family protein